MGTLKCLQNKRLITEMVITLSGINWNNKCDMLPLAVIRLSA